MRSALRRLTMTLPETLLAEAEHQLHPDQDLEGGQSKGPAANGVLRPGESITLTIPSAAPHADTSVILPENHTSIPSRPMPRPGLLSRIFHPTASLPSSLLSSNMRSPELCVPVAYTPTASALAYVPPWVWKPAVPTLWLARDRRGVSGNEVRALEKVGRSTDERAWVAEDGKLGWDRDHPTKCPVWEGSHEI